MNRKTSFSLIKQIDKNTPFPEALKASKLIHLVYALAGITYVLVAWIMSQAPTLPHGFVQWPESQYQQILLGASALTAIAVAITFLVLPKFTAPAYLIKKNAITTQEALGFELRQAQMSKIVVMQIPAILGLILFLFNGHWSHMVPFVLISLILLAITFPRDETWENAKEMLELEKMRHT